MRTALLSGLAALCVVAAQAQTPLESVVTNVEVPYCNSPHPSISSFLPSDEKAVLFFRFSQAPGGTLRNEWIRPDQTVHWSGSWSDTDQYSCYVSSLNIAGTSAASLVGTWRARVYLNGTMVVDISFRIGTTPTPTTTAYEGFFDDARCDKLYGWARDRNSSSAIRVDIYDGNQRLDSVLADEFREDLPGTKRYAFNYVPPPALKDGATHTMRIKYGGTNQELNGSPKLLTCSSTIIGPSNVTRWNYDYQNGYITAILEKEKLSGQTYTYRATIIGSSRTTGIGDLWKALLVVVYPHGVKVDRRNSRMESSNRDRQTVRTEPWNAAWETIRSKTLSERGEAGLNVLSNLVGLWDPIGYMQLANSFADFLGAGNREPSTWFSAKLEDENNNDVLRLPYEALRSPGGDFLGFYSTVNAIRFTVPNVDESSGGQPEFYLLFQSVNYEVVSFEIGLDRNALVWRR
ncbi:MAG: hypothetical protein IT165_28130 [Bryobacterales bacterium]|nr:hypothetical protein [Bryobacterales bacterium]